MRVFVELSQDIDPTTWAARNAVGEAADLTPYGLHHLERFGHVVRFGVPPQSRPIRRLGSRVSSRTWGLQPVHSLLTARLPTRSTADVVLCMDERNGIPAALAPWRPPVVSGIAWLGDDGDASWVKDATVTRALMRTAGLFTECRAMLEPLSSIRGVDPRRLHFVTLGIDENHFSPSSEPPIPDRVFSVGDDRMRDYGTLVAALRQVRRGRPGLTAEVATKLAIDIPEEWSIVHRRRMDHAVRARYHDAAVVALALQPTRSGSGLTVILEAMASARPVVVTDNPGLDDYVEHGVTGLLVPPHSPRAMAEAISSLLADPRKATAMGLAARERVERRFTTKHMAGDLDRVLRAAVPVPRHARR